MQRATMWVALGGPHGPSIFLRERKGSSPWCSPRGRASGGGARRQRTYVAPRARRLPDTNDGFGVAALTYSFSSSPSPSHAGDET